MNILIADSGSTKTDWCLYNDDHDSIQSFTTSGLNPYILSSFEFSEVLQQQIPNNLPEIDQIYFYGAGVKNDFMKSTVIDYLKERFPVAQIEAHSDLLGAARALCHHEPGIVGILGTGSNICFYNGEDIIFNHPALGFIVGDEGSGNHMGKCVLKHYYYQTFDPELMLAFEKKFGNDIQHTLERIYKGDRPNQYLAQFATMLLEHRGHYMIENIIEDCLMSYYSCHVLKMRESWQYPINFIGSVAYAFQDIIKEMNQEYGLTSGSFIQSPMNELIAFHKKAIHI